MASGITAELMTKTKKVLEGMEDTRDMCKRYREVCDFALEVGGEKFKSNAEAFQVASENMIKNLDGMCEDLHTTVQVYGETLEDAGF